jgi:hypothetical protein
MRPSLENRPSFDPGSRFELGTLSKSAITLYHYAIAHVDWPLRPIAWVGDLGYMLGAVIPFMLWCLVSGSYPPDFHITVTALVRTFGMVQQPS